MTPITAEQISEVYESLADALRVAHGAAEEALAAKVSLETVRAEAIRAGIIVGKNETEREACLRQKFADHYAALEEAERRGRETRHQVELVRLAVETLRMQLRVAELAAREEAV